jgi:hypothetical protein
MVDTLIKLADDLRAAGEDCKKGTAVIVAATKDIKPVMEEVEKLTEKDDAADDWFEARYDERIDAAMKDDPFVKLGNKCEKDDKFVQAMKDLGLGRAKRMEPPDDVDEGGAPVPAPEK